MPMPPLPKNPQTKYHAWYFIAAMIGILLLQQVWTQYQRVEVVPYSQFLDDLKAGKVEELRIEGNYIAGTLKEPLPSGKHEFITTRVPPELAQDLDRYGVKFSAVVQSTWVTTLLGWVIPTLLFFGIWAFVFRRFAAKQGGFGGLMQIGKSKAKIYDEKEQTLNQLLVELDGFDSTTGVVLLAATNRPEILDPALLRAGRFDRQVLVDRPDKVGRIQILKVHMKKAQLATDVDAEQIAALTAGFTGADLANLVNEAALLATRRSASQVEMRDFNAAIERIVAGLEKRNRLLNPLERKIVAYHELGHALTAMGLPGSDAVHKVSIIPRGIGALGYTIQRPTEERFLMTREELEHKMCVLLGGRAAEHLIFNHFSTGAADDLAKVTDIARNMVTRYGMEETLGPVAYDIDPPSFLDGPQMPGGRERRYSDETAHEIDRAVQRIVEQAFQRTAELLRRQRAVLERGAALLLEKETLDDGELRSLVGSAPAPIAAQ